MTAPHRSNTQADNPAPAKRLDSDITWRTSSGLIAYPEALETMETRVDAIAAAREPEQIWLLEHPSLYTAGTSADPKHLLNPHALPVFQTGRGGGYTYHGPGQRIAYVMLDVRRRFGGDVGQFVDALERWLSAALATFDLSTTPHASGARGLWVKTNHGECGEREPQSKKIASIGIRIRRGISLHGVSINVDPDLEYFNGIVACGGDGEAQTSLSELGKPTSLEAADQALRSKFPSLLNDVTDQSEAPR